MEKIKSIIRRIIETITKFLLTEEPEVDETEQDSLTDIQKEQIALLNEDYSKLLDVIENQIEMMHISFFTKHLDEDNYVRKQNELLARISAIKEQYTNSMNYICATA